MLVTVCSFFVMEIDNISILRLEAGSAEDIKNVLKELIDKNTQRFSFNELNQDNRRQKIWNVLFMHLEKQSSAICHKECLAAIRMLSRDKIDLDKLMSENWVDLLLTHAGLAPQEHHLTWYNLSDENYQIMVEAQKALCNLIYNSEKVQSICEKNKCIEEIVMRLRLFKEPNLPHSIKYFDMRMLFIITALCTSTRDRLKDELHGLTYLMETLDLIMNEAAVEGVEEITLNEEQVSLAAEVLKVLFNLMAKESCKPHFDEGDEDAHFLRLEIILKNLLLCKTEPKDNINNLRSHVVNLLTTVPGSCHKELISTVSSNDPPKGMEFEGKNMEAVAILLDFLDKKLSGQKSSENLKSQQDLLSPILTVLIECARSEKLLRRYLRMHILPPLRDVKTRPEEGDKLRNKLCRLLTSSVTNVRDLAAELLFILCKEDVARMIKYTGYGNAAGMFANRGLLGQRGQNTDNFSSNSEDSDTEEYTRYKDRINPVVGCYEPPRPDPMASMSDEQKEYEAIKLANMMDKLSREGLVQPCKIGVDGRPEPVEHILELQDDLPKQQIHNDSTDE